MYITTWCHPVLLPKSPIRVLIHPILCIQSTIKKSQSVSSRSWKQLQDNSDHLDQTARRHFRLWWFIIRIKHGFSCINIRQVPWEVLKTEAEGRGFQHLLRDLANVNTLKNHVRSLLLHKNWKHLLHFALFLALFCFAFSPMPRERNFHWLCSF